MDTEAIVQPILMLGFSNVCHHAAAHLNCTVANNDKRTKAQHPALNALPANDTAGIEGVRDTLHGKGFEPSDDEPGIPNLTWRPHVENRDTTHVGCTVFIPYSKPGGLGEKRKQRDLARSQ